MSDIVILQNCKLIFPDFYVLGSLKIESGHISHIELSGNIQEPHAEIIDCEGDFVGPGFIDIHNHGAFGTDFIDGEVEGLISALRYHQQQGSTSVLATLLTHPADQILKAIRRHVKAEKNKELPENFAGIHIEGPFLNPEKRGMHRIDWMHDPLPSEYQAWVREGEGWVRMLTAAAERKGALEMYAWLRTQKVIGSIGHTMLEWDQARMAAAAGASHFVHVNNAMDWPIRTKNSDGWLQTHARGVGSFLTTDLFTGEIIADGYHVTPELINLIVKTKGVDRAALVSDASPLTGLKPGHYSVATMSVEVRPGKLCLLADGSALASSVCTLLDMVRNMVRWGFSLLSAWRMASWTPARIVGLQDRGLIQAGNRADLIRLNGNLELKEVWQMGRRVM